MIAPDFASITSGLDAGPVIALILVGGTMVIGVGFGIWTSGSIAKFLDAGGSTRKPDESSKAAGGQESSPPQEETPHYFGVYTPTASRASTYSDSSSESWGVADAIASAPSSTSTSGSSDSTSSDFSGGGGDFGGGGSSGEW